MVVDFEWDEDAETPDNPEDTAFKEEELCPLFSWVNCKPFVCDRIGVGCYGMFSWWWFGWHL